jgi:hypothetical protein
MRTCLYITGGATISGSRRCKKGGTQNGAPVTLGCGTKEDLSTNLRRRTRTRKLGEYEDGKPNRLLRALLSFGFGLYLTIAMNLGTGRIYGFASNDKQWFPVSGSVEATR